MKIQLHAPRKLDGKLYHKGLHEVSEALQSDWFFKAQVKDGIIKILPKDEKAQAMQAMKDEHEVAKAAQQPKVEEPKVAEKEVKPASKSKK